MRWYPFGTRWRERTASWSGVAEHQHAPARHFDEDRVVAAPEVEGRLTSGLAAEAIGCCAERLAEHGRTVERVADIGSGPGFGTALLAERFPGAIVVAAGGSAAMLARAASRRRRATATPSAR